MHDPIGSGSMWGLAPVENESLLHAHYLIASASYNLLVNSGGFPVARTSGSVGSVPIRVLGLSGAEKVPLLLPTT